MKTHPVYLEYLSEFQAYGIKKEVIEQLTAQNKIAEILLPPELQKNDSSDKPVVGFLLGQDKADNGEEYYSISDNYLKAIEQTGVRIRFIDYDHPRAQMANCDAAILPGGAFNNPESFYIDGKVLGDDIGKRYFAYRDVINEAYQKHKPMLGICAGAQMIGAILGNMKMYRDLKSEVAHPAIHKPKTETDVRIHQIKLLQSTPIFDIIGIEPTQDHVTINSRHNQSMVHDVLQDYVAGTPKIKMDIYAISDSDGIPEIWGNEKAGILCVQGHPEDLISDSKMLNMYHYIAKKAREYRASHQMALLNKRAQTR